MSSIEEVMDNYYNYTLRYLKNNGVNVCYGTNINLCKNANMFYFNPWMYSEIREPIIDDLVLITPEEVNSIIPFNCRLKVDIVENLTIHNYVEEGSIVCLKTGDVYKLHIYNGTTWVAL